MTPPQTVREVIIPRGITDPRELMTILARGLQFPSYFGFNWDALFDCLCDLSWLEADTRVVLRHEDTPALPAGNTRHYLKVLSDAIDSWRGSPGRHTIEVIFPDAGTTARTNGTKPVT